MKKIIEYVKTNERCQKTLAIILYILIFIYTFAVLIITAANPPTVDNLTVEERIRYEQMIFP